MALAPYYVIGCDQPVPDYNCNPCPTTEKGRISTAAFIKPDYSFTNPTNPTEWLQAIQDGNVVLIPNVRGKYDGGSEKKGDGYGRAIDRLMNYTFKADFKDLNLYPNAAFYDTIDKTENWKFAFFTGTLVWLVDAPCTISTNDAVTEDAESDVVWTANIVWQSLFKPRKFIAPVGVQNCFALD